MQETLLATKLYIPTIRPALVPRPRLLEQLNNGMHRKLALISAPAGFGKTTLIAEWLDCLRLQSQNSKFKVSISWLSLDAGDNDPLRFLSYFIAALAQTGSLPPTFGDDVLSLLQSPQPPPSEAVLTTLINEIVATPIKFIFILDDYHLIEAQPIHDALSFLIENLPPNLHLIIATREDPLLSLSRLRSQDQMTELRAADLRFNFSEAAEFLNRVMGLNLIDEDVKSLETRTEGWIVGLQLAAISIQRQDNPSSLIKSFTGSHRLVLDYLIEEVLEQQPEHILDFLLQTSIMDRLNGSLCDAVTGQQDGQQTLEMLERSNLFVIPLDHERHWYRYHHLFAELLGQRLKKIQPDRIPDLHIKASKWFKRRGLNQEAIKHSLAAGDFQSSADLIKEIAIDIMQQGEHTTVSRWIKTLPEELVKAQPYLCVLHAWALQLSGQLDASESRLVDAESALSSQPARPDEKSDTIRGLIHSHRAYSTFMTGEHAKTIAFARQALEKLPENAELIRAQTALYLGVAYRYQGNFKEAKKTYTQIEPIIQNLGGKSIAALFYLHLGDLYRQMALLHKAKEAYEQALKLTEQHLGRIEMPFFGYVYVCLGRILRQWNQLDESYRMTAKGLGLCRDWNVSDILALSCIELAYILLALGNEDQANESIREASDIMDRFSQWGRQIAAAHQIRMDIVSGNLSSIERWIQTNDLDPRGDFEYHREVEYLSLVRVLIAQNQLDEAFDLARRIYEITQDINKKHSELESLILLAKISALQSDTKPALGYLHQALTIGEPEGFIRIFIDEGPTIEALLKNADAKHPAMQKYISELLSAFGPKATAAPPANQTLIEPLSERELEVLELLAAGLTNPEIADQLFLSIHTIKVHTRNIYGKLGVHSRMHAVSKARDLELITFS